MPHVVVSRSSRNPRLTRVRPLFYLPLALFCTSIVGGLAMIWLGWGRRPKPDAAALEEPEPGAAP